MRVAVFNTKKYDRTFLAEANSGHGHELTFLEPHLSPDTVPLARGHEAVCIFVNDEVDAATLEKLRGQGVRLVALRCSGFNNLNLLAARRHGITVVRVPAYSPYAVAEHAVGLLLALNRKIHRAFNRVREGNFALDGLMGFDVHGRVAGIVGTGRIGAVLARILHGFGCELLGYDIRPQNECEALGLRYVDLSELLAESDLISLHCPLMPETHHLIDADAVDLMKPGVTIINTSRGALIDTQAVIRGLKSGKIGALGLDVYEEEADLFFEDLSDQVLQDDTFARLLTFPNVVITGHQAYFTREALQRIADTTMANITAFEQTGACENAVSADRIRGTG